MHPMRQEGFGSCPPYVEEFIKRLKERAPVCFMLLFGSQARGEGHRYSDYDLFVVAKELPQDFWERIRLLTTDKPAWIDVIGFTVDETRKLIHREIILNALLEGKLLWGDENLFKELKTLAEHYLKRKKLKKMPWGYTFE